MIRRCCTESIDIWSSRAMSNRPAFGVLHQKPAIPTRPYQKANVRFLRSLAETGTAEISPKPVTSGASTSVGFGARPQEGRVTLLGAKPPMPFFGMRGPIADLGQPEPCRYPRTRKPTPIAYIVQNGYFWTKVGLRGSHE